MAALVLVSCASQSSNPFPGREIATIEIGAESLRVAVATTTNERSQGLMGVEDLGDLDGMIFVYESPQAVTFTMRNTLLPLDIWFIDSDGVIVGTAEMEPCLSEPCTRYGSPTEVLSVLETPLGKYEFALGSVVANIGSS